LVYVIIKFLRLLKIIFEPLVNKVRIEEIEKLDGADKLIKFIKFLINKGLFKWDIKYIK